MTDTLAQMQADIDQALLDKVLLNKAKSARQSNGKSNNGKLDNDAPSQAVVAKLKPSELNEVEISRIIEMAWEDRTPFDAIQHTYGLDESAVIDLMRREMKPSSFKLWRKRVSNRATKHTQKRGFEFGRAHCKTQYKPR